MQELKVPAVGESITEVQIGHWHKQEGEAVAKDELLVEIESEKATVDLAAPSAGVLSRILKTEGQTAAVGEVIGYLEPQAAPAKTPASTPASTAEGNGPQARVMPAAAALIAKHGLKPEQLEATGPGGRLTKEDVLRHVERAPAQTPTPEVRESRKPAPPSPEPGPKEPRPVVAPAGGPRQEEAVPMTPIRRRIAERLVEAQHQAALLTTFNEIDMAAVIGLRQKYREAFPKKYGVKLGFMSFFVRAAIESLKACPEVNAEIRGTDVVYRNFYDIGIAIGGGKGLVVPVLRSAERMSFAEIERAIEDFSARAQAAKLKPEELVGGTFTITNGGIYGSLLSTPIINPPQSGILGMHAIQERPVARDGQVVIRPMMYVALTYDHRIVDGREAVGFLYRIKELLEEPSRMLLEV
jgi:2-oxoglutarate dehydrogenase E2 component (dihydrolipoamide succinyltransferase)